MFRSLLFALAWSLLACSSAEPIEPEPEAFGPTSGAYVSREVPLHWHFDRDAWTIDLENGSIARTEPCLWSDESDLHRLAIELDEDALPHGAILLRMFLAIDPCDLPARAEMPDNYPVLVPRRLDRFGVETGVNTVQISMTDVADYVLPHEHEVEVVGGMLVDRTSFRYMAFFENEYGLHARSGMRVLGLRLHYAAP
jgi:hypothetical protein